MRFVAGIAFVMSVLGVSAAMAFAQPQRGVVPATGARGGQATGIRSIEPQPKFNVNNFRSIIVGDSQTTSPDSNRIRTQTHRWDAPIVGELLGVGATSTGFVVNNSNAGIGSLMYQNVDMNNGWSDGGPNDFFALYAAQWTCLDDIDAPGSRIGRYRLRFGGNNVNAPWDQPWGIGQPLVARIAVRTGPMSVDGVETRADRGGLVSFQSRTIHPLSKQWGVQIIEQFIPADFNPMGDDVGVSLFLPADSVEQPGQTLQILGVLIERVGSMGQRLPGTLIGYQGRGGWSMDDHINGISQASRMALIEMCEADRVVVIQGHNREPGGAESIEGNLNTVVGLWEQAYAMLGRARPGFVFVVPWTIVNPDVSDYLLEIERAMGVRASMHRNDTMINYLPLFEYQRPDVFDPARYQLDGAGVHPNDTNTAVNLSQDLYEMLFLGRRE